MPARSRQGHRGVGVTLSVHDGEALALEDAEERSGRSGGDPRPAGHLSRPPWGPGGQLSPQLRPRAPRPCKVLPGGSRLINRDGRAGKQSGDIWRQEKVCVHPGKREKQPGCGGHVAGVDCKKTHNK